MGSLAVLNGDSELVISTWDRKTQTDTDYNLTNAKGLSSSQRTLLRTSGRSRSRILPLSWLHFHPFGLNLQKLEMGLTS